MALCLALVWLFFMGRSTLQSRHTPDRGNASMLPQRLGLASLYATTLPEPLREAMNGLALALERDPRNAAILRREAGPSASSLAEGYRLAAEYQRAPDPATLPQLRALAYAGLLRVALPSFLVLGVTLMAVLRLWSGPDPSKEEVPDSAGSAELADHVSPWTALALFTGWQLIGWGPLLWLTGRLIPPGIPGLLAAQSVSYLLFLALLYAAGRGGGWRPWNGFDGGWLARGYLLCLLLMTAADLAVLGLTGVDPFDRDPVLGILLAATPGERWLLAGWIVAVGPAFEELLFRGFLLGAFRGAWGDSRALLASSFLFALAHGNLWGWPSLFLGGLVLGWTALRTGSCATSAALHGLWNLTWLCHVVTTLPGDLW